MWPREATPSCREGAFKTSNQWKNALQTKWKKWNESGFRPPLCTSRLNWARRASWGWWDDWDDTVLQTQDSKFEPWWSEPSTLPLGHGGSPQYWLSHVDGEKHFRFFQTTTLGPPPTHQTQDSKFKPRWFEAQHATFRLHSFLTILC